MEKKSFSYRNVRETFQYTPHTRRKTTTVSTMAFLHYAVASVVIATFGANVAVGEYRDLLFFFFINKNT